jgi:hypothetical protein
VQCARDKYILFPKTTIYFSRIFLKHLEGVGLGLTTIKSSRSNGGYLL